MPHVAEHSDHAVAFLLPDDLDEYVDA
jgi:hypothetical protein